MDIIKANVVELNRGITAQEMRMREVFKEAHFTETKLYYFETLVNIRRTQRFIHGF